MNDNEETAVVDEEEIPATEDLEQEETQSAQPEVEGESPDASENEATDEGEPTGEESEEVSGVDIVIDGETPPQEVEEQEHSDPNLVNKLRKKLRDKDKRIREFERNQKQEAENQEQLVLGPRPVLYEDGYEDEAKFAKGTDAWYERKGKIESEKERQTGLQKQEQERMQQVETSYADKKKAFSGLVTDYDDAESAIEQAFDRTQQGILLTGASNPATMAYTLYKRPALLEEMSKIKDPVKFAIALGELQTKSKVKPRKPNTRPEKTVSGHNKMNAGAQAQMDKLEKEYDKTGDRTKINALKREQRELARKEAETN